MMGSSGKVICITCGWRGIDSEVQHYNRREYFNDVHDDDTGKHDYVVDKCPNCGMEESIRKIKVKPT